MSKEIIKEEVINKLEECYRLLATIYSENTDLCMKLTDLCHTAIFRYEKTNF